MTRLLVVDGYDEVGKAALRKAGATKAGLLYQRMLSELALGSQIDIADLSLEHPASIDIEKYQGVCWTGSNLFFSSTNRIVQRHIDLCDAFFETGTPQFGSCWAAQLTAKTAGGDVGQNPKGREFGFARRITLTEAGLTHPMYAGKPPAFEGFTSHGDIITDMPSTGTLLAGNSFSPVQALEVQYKKGMFWAVQYHPEYDFSEIACLAKVRKTELVNQGQFRDEANVLSYAAELDAFNREPKKPDIVSRYNIDNSVIDHRLRTLEVSNWLAYFFDL